MPRPTDPAAASTEPIRVHVDGGHRDPASCPKSNAGRCPACGAELHGHYGLAGGYGIGTSYWCANEACDAGPFDFSPDTW
jgi:hypothetical protein